MTTTQAPSGDLAAFDAPSTALPTQSGDRIPEAPEPLEPSRMSAGRLVAVVVIAVVTFLIAIAAVMYGLGALTYARNQRALVATERSATALAAIETNGLGGVHLPAQPPAPGTVVGMLAIPALGVNEAVIEGVSSSQTSSGPGHVPGTAGLGQPGNSAVVARSAAYGGAFAHLGQLQRGDRILTATIEGQSVYVVKHIRRMTMGPAPTAGWSATGSSLPTNAGGPATSSSTRTDEFSAIYNPTADDQLTLVTSGSVVPWNTSRAIVVTAQMAGTPYVPTPQESRSSNQQGNTGDPVAWILFLLALIGLAVTVVGAAFLYRRCTMRSAYLLTTIPLLVLTVLAAISISRLLPAWT